MAYGYDSAGNKTSLTTTYANGDARTELYAYDAMNRLVSVTDNASQTTTFTYDAVGNQTQIDYANGLVSSYEYDNLNRITAVTTSDANDNILTHYAYSLNATGRRTQLNEQNGRTSTYTYDDVYRLTQESILDPVNGDHNSSYSYDAVGNRSQSTINGTTTDFSYDDNDRLLSQGVFTYSYDSQGNLLSESDGSTTKTYSYNANNKLTGFTDGSNTLVYQYNPDGIRVNKTLNANLTTYVVDSNQAYAQVIAEQDASDVVGKEYVFGNDLLSQIEGSDSHFYHYDGLGTTRELSDSTGAISDSYAYEAFGELLGQQGTTDNNYLYTGEQYDPELDNYYLRARYYNQDVGRFTQMDSWNGVKLLPLSLNKYLYAEADPINAVDPSGNYSSFVELGVANNISRTLTTISVPRIAVGFSFVRNRAGIIAGIATATVCATGAAADQFKLVENIAAFSKKCDGGSHRGRWQAQGGGLEESEPWNQPSPLTLSEGLLLLDILELKLKPKDRKARAVYFEQARLYAIRISLKGGISAAEFRPRSFPNGPQGSAARVDLEIKSGRAFVPD